VTDLGRTTLFALLALALVLAMASGPPTAPPLGPEHPAPPCEVAVERQGQGVFCLTPAEAAAAGLRAGDRVTVDGGVDRMAPERVALFAAPVDLNAASLAELEALPGVGPGLAARIAAGRPYRDVEELARVPGLGPRRLAALRGRVLVGEAADAGQ